MREGLFHAAEQDMRAQQDRHVVDVEQRAVVLRSYAVDAGLAADVLVVLLAGARPLDPPEAIGVLIVDRALTGTARKADFDGALDVELGAFAARFPLLLSRRTSVERALPGVPRRDRRHAI